MLIMTPCFYCNKNAEYMSLKTEKVEDVFKIVEVCKDHFVFPGAS